MDEIETAPNLKIWLHKEAKATCTWKKPYLKCSHGSLCTMIFSGYFVQQQRAPGPHWPQTEGGKQDPTVTGIMKQGC